MPDFLEEEMRVPGFGRVQLKIMQVLWRKKCATAREITDALNETEPIAHSTVQTLLRKLEVKGAIAHDVADRTFVYRPLADPERVRRNATRELVDRVFGGSPGGLVSYLLRHERITKEELDEIRRVIDEPPEDRQSPK
jgi:BlaI family penicillinase repressor